MIRESGVWDNLGGEILNLVKRVANQRVGGIENGRNYGLMPLKLIRMTGI